MQKIWIAGSSGSGKTTLANLIGIRLNIPVYHRDQISWKENWQERTEEEQIKIVRDITDQEQWIFEGNRFTAARVDGRLEKCDTLIYIKMNRFICLYRGVRRYLKHRNNPRPDLNVGCQEEYPLEVMKYVLWDYPNKKDSREKLFEAARKAGKTVIVLNGRKEVKKWWRKLQR